MPVESASISTVLGAMLAQVAVTVEGSDVLDHAQPDTDKEAAVKAVLGSLIPFEQKQSSQAAAKPVSGGMAAVCHASHVYL